ncbi:hypothetical protein O0L34_g14619 [Tuta absoluta]|nr:hypothetical protein O0L34_g14619 [Tuta absoluta]
MESHVLNTYQVARYRGIGHKLLRSSGSLSEDSCKTSPEYQPAQFHWTANQTINMTRSQETSSDEEENIEVQEVVYDDGPEAHSEVVEEQVLVEGDDYDVIQVYAVDPDLDLEGSSDEEPEDFAISNNIVTKQEIGEEYFIVNDNPHRKAIHESQAIDGYNFNLDTPVVSNVDEYFIKEDRDKDILAVRDEPVVQDVDEYFIKEEKTPNVDDFFIKDKLPEEEVPKPVNVDEFFVSNVKPPEKIEQNITTEQNVIEQNVIEQNIDNADAEVPINESDLEVLPNIEDLKRFLLEDMSHSNYKTAQRSCSLPQSPMHNICLDIDDAKTCLSFEDLNLDLSDLTFDNDKDKSSGSAKSDDIPRTLTEDDVNSFLITSLNKPENKGIIRPEPVIEDDLSHQDMEMEEPVQSSIEPVIIPEIKTPVKILIPKTSTPIKSTIHSSSELIIPEVRTPVRNSVPKTAKQINSTEQSSMEPVIIPEVKTPIKISVPKTSTPVKSILNFCVEKSAVKKKENADIKVESDDFVDVESCNDTVIPVLAANNLNSLLEQFEATEKLNTKPKKVIKSEEQKVKSASLTNGMRLQDAGVQLNKTKMRQILMPSTVNATVRRSPSPVHSDHDYCSSKKRYSLPNIKGGQSLLKPEVLSSNNKILSSRHRSCRNKKVVYALSSDDESDKKNKKISDDNDIKSKKLSVKQTVKVITQPTRKKLSPVYSEPNDFKYKDKINSSVIVKDACKASDTPCSQNSNGSIKLTIKNKSEVILNCDVRDSQKHKLIEKCKSSVSEKTETKTVEAQNNLKNEIKNIKEVDRNKKSVNNIDTSTCSNVVKEETRPKEGKEEHFYTALFSNKQDVQVPQAMQIKSEKRSFEEEISIATKPIKEEQPQKKKKLNLQEYKMRRCASSNNSSAAVSPEAIFPDMPHSLNIDKSQKSTPNQTPPNGVINSVDQANPEPPMKIFDPIREASRKILMNTKKQKAEAIRKRDEDIVMSKIPKVENLELQPLISDAEMMKIVGMTQPDALPVPVEKPQAPANIEEIVMVSVGVNTDETVFKDLEKSQRAKKSQSPEDPKALINFKIKKSDQVLKQNVFNATKGDKKSPVNDKKPEMRIDKERFKDITATLKSVKKQVDTKNYSNSLFASIQDVVKKKAPEEEKPTQSKNDKRSKSNSPKRKAPLIKPRIIRDYDEKADHGEDKIILHLGKDRVKPVSATIITQTDPNPNYAVLPIIPVEVATETKTKTPTPPRKRNDSDMSMSSDDDMKKGSPKSLDKPKERRSREVRSHSKEKRSRSKDRVKYRRTRSRSRSRSRRHRRSHTRSRSRSRGRFRRYRRSVSPYRRKRRSRSPYRRRSPSSRREYRSNRSRSRNNDTRSKSPKKRSPQSVDRKPVKSMTPPMPRKPTVSESSDSSTSSSSSSSSDDTMVSSASRVSRASRQSCSPYRRQGPRPYRSSYSSEDREANTPVEERRIVFVGKLEKDITKSALRSQFTRFGPVLEVRLHSKEDGTRYGFVTFKHARDAWSAVEAASTFPQYDVGFGGRRAFCRQSYADLDGLEAKYTESAFHGSASALPPRRDHHMTFEQMLLEMRNKLSQRQKKDDTA